MPPKKQKLRDDELFRMRLSNMIDMEHQLVKLAGMIDWSRFDEAYGRFYTPPPWRANAGLRAAQRPINRNRYSVLSTMTRRTVQIRAYATRTVVRCGEEIVAEHPRYFGRGRTIYDPWHYLSVLARKPGALRNGAPFQDWGLPPALARLRRKLGNGDRNGERRPNPQHPVATPGATASAHDHHLRG